VKKLVSKLIGTFQDNSIRDKLDKEEKKKKRNQEEFGIHWTNPQKVLKACCQVCGRESSTVYQCYQCQVNIHPCCMKQYHNWI